MVRVHRGMPKLLRVAMAAGSLRHIAVMDFFPTRVPWQLAW